MAFNLSAKRAASATLATLPRLTRRNLIVCHGRLAYCYWNNGICYDRTGYRKECHEEHGSGAEDTEVTPFDDYTFAPIAEATVNKNLLATALTCTYTWLL